MDPKKPALDGRVVVVTGASTGVGRATARAFAAHGAHVALLARGRDGLEAAAREVTRIGRRALVVPTDVGDPEQVERAAAAILSEFDRIDVWVNNAMVTVFSPVEEMSSADYQRVTEVTYLGTVYGTQAALRSMLPHDKGTIVQVGSALAYRGIPLQSAYCAAKHAIQGFTESLRCELLHNKSGIKLCIVQLPAVNTPQFDLVKSRMHRRAQPIPPIFQPEVAAEAIVYAAQHGKKEMYVGAQTVKSILGSRMFPSVADRVLANRGYDEQLDGPPEDPARAHNLWSPVPGDHGAHGRFDDRALPRSAQLWADTHRGTVGLAAGLAGLATFAAIRRLRH